MRKKAEQKYVNLEKKLKKDFEAQEERRVQEMKEREQELINGAKMQVSVEDEEVAKNSS